MLSPVNFADAVVDGHIKGPQLVCSALLPSQKDEGKMRLLPPQAAQLLPYPLLQLFPPSYFILGLWGMSGYLPNMC